MRIFPGRRLKEAQVCSCSAIAFSPDGRFLVAGGNILGLDRWELDQRGERLRILDDVSLPRRLIHFDEGRKLMAVARRKGILSYDWATETEQMELEAERIHDGIIRDDGHAALIMDGYWLRMMRRGDRGTWSSYWDRDLVTYTVRDLAFFPQADQIAVILGSVSHSRDAETGQAGAPRPPRLLIADAIGGEELRLLQLPHGDASTIRIDPHGEQVLVMGSSGWTVWKVRRPELPLRLIHKPIEGAILDAAFHPSGRILATVHGDDSVRFWDAESWKLQREYRWPVSPLGRIAFSADGMLVAAVADQTMQIIVWDLED